MSNIVYNDKEKRISDFYDIESLNYSHKRYESKLQTYHQWVFRYRQDHFLKIISLIQKKFLDKKTGMSLFDIGCADGSVLRFMNKKFPGLFSKIVAVDISKGMVKMAKELTRDLVFSYYVRGEELNSKYDIVTELGVHVSDLDKELDYVNKYLDNNGYYIYAVAGKNSIHAHLKLKGKKDSDYYNDYLSYNEIEEKLKQIGEIVYKKPYGLFVPKLWSLKGLSGKLQIFVDYVFGLFTVELFHEVIYLVKKTDKQQIN